MKTRHILILFLLLFMDIGIAYSQSQSLGKNYILTRTYRDSLASTWVDVIHYYDGLGRPVEIVQKGVTPNGRDLVTLQEYDEMGRESKSWLPAIAAMSNDGNYVAIPDVRIGAVNDHLNDSKPYSRIEYEPSPLNRIFKQFGPGEAWQTNDQKTEKSIRTSYYVNIEPNNSNGFDSTMNCIQYICQNPLSWNQFPYLSVTKKGNYATGELYITCIDNEEGYTVFEFKDKQGQVLLTRQIGPAGNDFCDTYYLYDNFGNLRMVLPPILSDILKNIPDNQEIGSGTSILYSDILNYAYMYHYDNRNRCIAKQLPGTGEWDLYLYDKADRLIFTRERGQWTFAIPDKFGRVCMTGTFYSYSNFMVFDNIISNYAFNNPIKDVIITAVRDTSNTAIKGYSIEGYNSIGGFSINEPVVLSVNYYDNYDYTFIAYSNISTNVDTPNTNDAFTKYDSPAEGGLSTRYTDATGLLTGTWAKQMEGESSHVYSAIYYDDRNRVIQVSSKDHMDWNYSAHREYVAYNFTGQPIRKRNFYQISPNDVEELYTYTYDHAGRLDSTKHQVNGMETIVLAKNKYDEFGRLEEKISNNNPLLTTSYQYNIRSWITNIINPLFTENLTYGYIGNIDTLQWIQASKTRKYTYTYDPLSRLTGAAYTGDNDYNTTYTYDKHGNMTTLVRYGNTGATASGIIDNLAMTYNGNQLIGVSDTGITPTLSSSVDFQNRAVDWVYGSQYGYNHGYLVQDPNRGVQISYNVFGLPYTVHTSGKGQLINIYSGNGTKLRDISTKYAYSDTTLVMDYVGNLIRKDYVVGGGGSYANYRTYRLLVDGGYHEVGGYEGYYDENWEYKTRYVSGTYYFYIQDHLGNNRIVADKNGAIMQSTQYYPFGMAFADGFGEGAQPYKYNGKEFKAENDLYLYDYGARHYDPALGRFTTMDPLAEKHYNVSPYAYVLNNPLKFIDPTGMAEIDPDWLTDWLAGWNKRIGEFNDNFNKGFLDRLDNPSLLLQDANNMAQGILSLASDVTGITNLVGGENKTAQAVSGIVNTISEIPNMSAGEIGEVSASAVIFAAGMAITKKAPATNAAKAGIAESRALGIAGENAVGITGPKTAIKVDGRTRIPDGMTRQELIEVKNVGHLNYTRQLRDFQSYSQQTGRQFVLYTRPSTPGTTFSKPLQNAINQGTIINKPIPVK